MKSLPSFCPEVELKYPFKLPKAVLAASYFPEISISLMKLINPKSELSGELMNCLSKAMVSLAVLISKLVSVVMLFAFYKLGTKIYWGCLNMEKVGEYHSINSRLWLYF